MVMVVMLFALSTSCNNAQQEQGATEEDTEMSEESMGEMHDDEMDMPDKHMQERHEEVNEENLAGMQVTEFLSEYIDMKNSLVKDNYDEVNNEAEDFLNSLESNEDLSEDRRTNLENTTQQIISAENIKAQRNYFAELSKELYQVVQATELTDETLYWAHCPMALNNEGANWLSFDQEIQNPFMGQRMPKCGSVKETIN